MRPNFQNLRHFVGIASNNSSTFPKNSNASTMAHENINEVLITKDFAQKIECGFIFNRNALDYDPILQIIDESTKFRKFTLNSRE